MMTLYQFEEHADSEFAACLSAAIAQESDHDFFAIASAMVERLERQALSEGVEVCERMSHLLVLALYDLHLDLYSEELGVPQDYFEGSRPKEEEALNYLHERRLGAPARHNALPVN